jgi:Na+-transporting NADH:ubiquinone oxidoreductase subunit NqrB
MSIAKLDYRQYLPGSASKTNRSIASKDVYLFLGKHFFQPVLSARKSNISYSFSSGAVSLFSDLSLLWRRGGGRSKASALLTLHTSPAPDRHERQLHVESGYLSSGYSINLIYQDDKPSYHMAAYDI